MANKNPKATLKQNFWETTIFDNSIKLRGDTFDTGDTFDVTTRNELSTKGCTIPPGK